MNQVRTVIFIQILNSFVNGILGIALPLMMDERNIDIATIGLVFASLPMIFQLGRMFFATISDFWGRKLFFVLNGVLSVVSSFIYYLAYTPLEFLFGKFIEGTKDGSLWAVNRAFLLERSEGKWMILVRLRTATYVAFAVGSLFAGFFIVWFFYEGTLILCGLAGAVVVPVALLLFGGRKEKFSVSKAFHLVDLRNRTKMFKVFLILFFTMGLSFGFREGFVFPLFLRQNGFHDEVIGVLLGLQILLAGLFSYLFAKRFRMEKLILLSGILYTVVLLLLGFSSWVLAGVLASVFGIAEGLLSIVQEGMLSKIANKASYGTDIGLQMMGLHSGRALSMAMSGFLIKMCGFMAPFSMSALIFVVFYAGSYCILKQ